MTQAKVLGTLSKLVDEADFAMMRLSDFLLAVHDSHHWDDITYAEMADAMGVTRQAVNQRVHRLLQGHRYGVRLSRSDIDPNQLTIGD